MCLIAVLCALRILVFLHELWHDLWKKEVLYLGTIFGFWKEQVLYLVTLYDVWKWYDMIYLLTAIGLTPSGSSTVHIYVQTVHRTTQ